MENSQRGRTRLPNSWAAAAVPVVPAAADGRADGFGPGTGRVAAGDSAGAGAVDGDESRTMRIRGAADLFDSDSGCNSVSGVTVRTAAGGTSLFGTDELIEFPDIEGAGVLVMVGTRCIVEIPVVDSFGFAVDALD